MNITREWHRRGTRIAGLIAVVVIATAGLLFAACGGAGQTAADATVSPGSKTFIPESGSVTPSPTVEAAKWQQGTARCPVPPHVFVPPSGVALGAATKAFCVVWANEYSDGVGFRVSVEYASGEVFTHQIPPGQHDFVFPSSEAPILSGPLCTGRRSYSISVIVLRNGGEEPVGEVSVIAECAP